MSAKHCLITLLWSESDDNGDSLDGLDAEPSQELLDKIAADWDSFCSQAEAMGFVPEEHLAIALHPDNDSDAWNQAAHDFILTRNGHGAGFWDGDWHKPWGDKLTELCRKFGELNCYVGDNNFIYCL
jgi:hypothetical protein